MNKLDLLADKGGSIIVGCGWLGSNIATMLSSHGQDVVIIDSGASSFRKLGPEYSGFTVEADGADIDVLKKADIEKAAHVIAATDDDNVNIMIAQIAKVIFKVPLVVIRLYDPEKEIILDGYDIKTIYPSKLSMSAFEAMLSQ